MNNNAFVFVITLFIFGAAVAAGYSLNDHLRDVSVGYYVLADVLSSIGIIGTILSIIGLLSELPDYD